MGSILTIVHLRCMQIMLSHFREQPKLEVAVKLPSNPMPLGVQGG